MATMLSFIQNYLRQKFEEEKIDWHDYEFIDYEKTRQGPGERSGYELTDPEEITQNEESLKIYGVSMVVSDKVSLTRALDDPRVERCKELRYSKSLPSASVIVIFYNEPLTVLLRCVHSIYNRSPKNLLHEIILINDNSTYSDLYEPLESYITDKFSEKVKLFHNSKRLGLIVTRLEGAQKATGDVIVFLDSHMEVTTNWLPPLLDPIKDNRKTATVPVIDVISAKTLHYSAVSDRINGGFNWDFKYQFFVMSNREKPPDGEPFVLHAMTGGAYAIDRKYFFELGEYDRGMFLYNGENYELSFKLLLCGGNLLKIPCSRVGHLQHTIPSYSYTMNGINYNDRNLKRVVEVWWDEYKEMFYKNHPERRDIDAGDLTEAIEVKNNLNCKPFKYYLEVIAPQILERNPLERRPDFASGAIQSIANKSLCISNEEKYDELKLANCSNDLKHPKAGQDFNLTWHREIRINDELEYCVNDNYVYACHFQQGNQMYRYVLETSQIMRPFFNDCLTANLELSTLILTPCNASNTLQKWEIGYKNIELLNNWEGYGAKFRD